VQNVVNPRAGSLTSLKVANIALDKLEASPLLWINSRLNFCQICSFPRRKVVQSDNRLSQVKKVLQKVRADKAGNTGDQPGLRGLLKFDLNMFVASRNCNP
jgi:hypothetical protein